MVLRPASCVKAHKKVLKMSGCGRVLAQNAVVLGSPFSLRCIRALFLHSGPGTLKGRERWPGVIFTSFISVSGWCRWTSRVLRVSLRGLPLSTLFMCLGLQEGRYGRLFANIRPVHWRTVASHCQCQFRLDPLEDRRCRHAATLSLRHLRVMDLESRPFVVTGPSMAI